MSCWVYLWHYAELKSGGELELSESEAKVNFQQPPGNAFNVKCKPHTPHVEKHLESRSYNKSCHSDRSNTCINLQTLAIPTLNSYENSNISRHSAEREPQPNPKLKTLQP